MSEAFNHWLESMKSTPMSGRSIFARALGLSYWSHDAYGQWLVLKPDRQGRKERQRLYACQMLSRGRLSWLYGALYWRMKGLRRYERWLSLDGVIQSKSEPTEGWLRRSWERYQSNMHEIIGGQVMAQAGSKGRSTSTWSLKAWWRQLWDGKSKRGDSSTVLGPAALPVDAGAPALAPTPGQAEAQVVAEVSAHAGAAEADPVSPPGPQAEVCLEIVPWGIDCVGFATGYRFIDDDAMLRRHYGVFSLLERSDQKVEREETYGAYTKTRVEAREAGKLLPRYEGKHPEVPYYVFAGMDKIIDDDGLDLKVASMGVQRQEIDKSMKEERMLLLPEGLYHLLMREAWRERGKQRLGLKRWGIDEVKILGDRVLKHLHPDRHEGRELYKSGSYQFSSVNEDFRHLLGKLRELDGEQVLLWKSSRENWIEESVLSLDEVAELEQHVAEERDCYAASDFMLWLLEKWFQFEKVYGEARVVLAIIRGEEDLLQGKDYSDYIKNALQRRDDPKRRMSQAIRASLGMESEQAKYLQGRLSGANYVVYLDKILGRMGVIQREVELGKPKAQALGGRYEEQLDEYMALMESLRPVFEMHKTIRKLENVSAEFQQKAAEQDVQIELAEQQRAARERMIALQAKDTALQEKDAVLATKDAEIAANKAAIAEKNRILAELMADAQKEQPTSRSGTTADPKTTGSGSMLTEGRMNQQAQWGHKQDQSASGTSGMLVPDSVQDEGTFGSDGSDSDAEDFDGGHDGDQMQIKGVPI